VVPGDFDVGLGIDFISVNQGVMGGWHINFAGDFIGNAFYTSDAGTNWIEATIPDSMRVMVNTQMINNSIAYGAGAYNQSVTNPIQNFQNNYNHQPSINMFCKMIGMTIDRQQDYRGYFVETTDGGLTWHPKGAFEDSVYYLVGLHFLDAQTGFVLANGPYNNSFASILKTTDGGNSWNYVYEFEAFLFLNDIKFSDQMNGIVVGTFDDMTDYYSVILKTTDGGNTWIKIVLPELASVNKVTYVNGNTLLLNGINLLGQAVIYKSEDAGNNWQEYRNYGEFVFTNDINSLINSGIILITGQQESTGDLLLFTDISTDYGATWSYGLHPPFQNFYPIFSKMITESHWYITGTINSSVLQGFVLHTYNAGGVPVELISFSSEIFNGKVKLTWSTASELNNRGFEIERSSDNDVWKSIGFVAGKGTTTEIQNYSFTDDLFSFTWTKNYYRLKQIDFDGLFEYSEVLEVKLTFPTEFSLFQNYPNPFNPSTVIRFQIPGQARNDNVLVTLKVYDILGNEIATLVNEEKPAGEYEVEFNGHSDEGQNLPSGVYFYQLKSGNFIQTKKMVYLK
jgi:FlgD Ig-like domain